MENLETTQLDVITASVSTPDVIDKLKAEISSKKSETSSSETSMQTTHASKAATSDTTTNDIATSEAATAADWLQSLPEEFKKPLAKFKDVSGLARSYLEAEKTLSKRLAIPDEKASIDEWGQFYNKLGRPEDKKYLEADERNVEDQDLLAKYETVLYESGISKRQGQDLLKRFETLTSELAVNSNTNLQAQKDQHLASLQKTYGDTFDQKIPLMSAAMQKIGSKDLADLVAQTQYHPGLMQLLISYGETLKSDALISGTTMPKVIGKESALAEIKRLTCDQNFMVQYTTDGLGHDAAVKQMMELHQIAYAK